MTVPAGRSGVMVNEVDGSREAAVPAAHLGAAAAVVLRRPCLMRGFPEEGRKGGGNKEGTPWTYGPL